MCKLDRKALACLAYPQTSKSLQGPDLRSWIVIDHLVCIYGERLTFMG